MLILAPISHRLTLDGWNGTARLSPLIHTLVALAPVTYIAHCKSFLIDGLADLGVDELVSLLGIKQFLPNTTFFDDLLPVLCKTLPFVCDSTVWMIAGDTSQHINQTRLPVYMGHFPSGTSTRDIIHWAQGFALRDGDVYQFYDWGEATNLVKYGQRTPPTYNVTNFPTTTRLVVYHGALDDLADHTDVNHFLTMLPPGALTYAQEFSTYGHLDFTWGDAATADVYLPSLQYLTK